MASELKDGLARCSEIFQRARRIVVFSGAGVSAESGIPTFRDPGGLWTAFPPDQFANWASILRLVSTDPVLLANFLVALLRPIVSARPNAAHLAIAAIEGKEKAVTVVTQNIDGLHQSAGSTTVIELHGSLFEVGYVRSHETWPVSSDALKRVLQSMEQFCRDRGSAAAFMEAVSPLYGKTQKGIYLPRVVLFGDFLPERAWEDASYALKKCDCMIIVGTSQVVQPAGSLSELATSHGAPIIGIGPEPIQCDAWLRGSACEILPRLVEAMPPV